MQSKRDQQTVQERIDTCANCAQACDAFAQRYQATKDQRPCKQQDCCSDDGNNACDDRNAALAGEEGQPVGQLCSLKLVVAYRADHTCQNTDERVLDLAERKACLCIFSDRRHQGCYNACGKQGCDHQPGSQSRKAACTVVVVRHADADTDREQDRDVINQSAARFYKEETNHLDNTSNFTALHGRRTHQISDAHQNTADRQTCNRKH